MHCTYNVQAHKLPIDSSFTLQYGNVDECYEKLKDNYTDEYDLPAERSFTLPSRPTPTSVNGITTNESPRPSLQRSPTYGPGITDTGGYHGYASAVPPPSLPGGYASHRYTPVSLVTSSPHDFRVSEADTSKECICTSLDRMCSFEFYYSTTA